jgi:hypothetical protein
VMQQAVGIVESQQERAERRVCPQLGIVVDLVIAKEFLGVPSAAPPSGTFVIAGI